MKIQTKTITRAGILGALYCVVTLVMYPFSFGPIQFRISEAMCILPLFFPESIFGLTVGCLIANIFSAVNPLLDVPLGTGATLLASVCTYLIGKAIKHDWLRLILGIIPPILFNALIVPFSILAVSELAVAYALTAVQVGLGEAGVLIIIGIPLYFIIKKLTPKINSAKEQ